MLHVRKCLGGSAQLRPSVENWSSGRLRDSTTTVNLNRKLGYFKFPEEN